MTEFKPNKHHISSFLDFNHELFDDHKTSRRVKRDWIERGYTEQLSIYGVVSDLEVDDKRYKRIEVLSNLPYNPGLIEKIYLFFMDFIPISSYSIWIYDHNEDRIREIGAW